MQQRGLCRRAVSACRIRVSYKPYGASQAVAYLGFQKGGCADVVGCGEGSGEGPVPPTQKKNHFYVPKMILTRLFDLL